MFSKRDLALFLPDDADQNVVVPKDDGESTYKKPVPRFDPSKKVRRYRQGFSFFGQIVPLYWSNGLYIFPFFIILLCL